MTSTLWFWIICIIVILTIIWILRRFIGRVIILCITLVILFFVYKLIAPTSAANLLNWFKDVPAKATNFVNRELLNKDIIIPLSSDIRDNVYDSVSDSVSGLVDGAESSLKDVKDSITDSVDNIVDETKVSVDDIVDVEIEEEQEDESRYSWFARLFKKNKKTEVQEEKSENSENIWGVEIDELEVITWVEADEKNEDKVEIKLSSGAVVIETINASWEKIVEEVVTLKGREESEVKTWVVKETTVKTWVVKTWAVRESVVKTWVVKTWAKASVKSKTWNKADEDVVIIPSNPKNPKNIEGNGGVKTSWTVVTTSRWGLTTEEIRETNSIFN